MQFTQDAQSCKMRRGAPVIGLIPLPTLRISPTDFEHTVPPSQWQIINIHGSAARSLRDDVILDSIPNHHSSS